MNWEQFLVWFKEFLNRAFNPFYEYESKWAPPQQFLRNAFWPFKEGAEV